MATNATAQERAIEVVAKNSCEVILVGVDEYESARLPALTYAGADAKKLRGALTKIGVPEESVRLFVSGGKIAERPNKAAIMAALDEAVKNSGPNSTVLIALSGHGFETSDGEAAFCPEDAKISVSDDETYVDKSSAILISDVVKKLREDDAGFKFLIVDACRAPAEAKTLSGRSFASVDARGLAFLQSCSSGECSWEDASVEGGLFTHCLVNGLTGAAADKEGGVSLLGLCDYASNETARLARNLRDISQTPRSSMADAKNFYLVEPGGAQNGGDAGRLALANALFMEAFRAYDAKDYKTAQSKCELSLAALETQAARDLLPKIKKALEDADPEPGARKALTVNGITYNFRYCPSGTFTMGSPTSEPGREDDETQHRVTLDGFWMLETEVTVGMWRSFVRETGYQTGPGVNGQGGLGSHPQTGQLVASPFFTWENPGFLFGFRQTDDHPVTQIDWNGAVAFCEWISRKTGESIRLPSEAEWEYACRAGSKTSYSFGDSASDLTKYGNIADVSYSGIGMFSADDGCVFTSPAKSFKPNAWGLYDMHGNVFEWCLDRYDTDYYATSNSERNPVNVTRGSNRVVRGGCWDHGVKGCRSAGRANCVPTSRLYDLGFRLALGREL